MNDLENVEPVDVEQWLDGDGLIGPDSDGTLPLDISEEHTSKARYDMGHEFDIISDPEDPSEDAWAVLLNEPYKDVVLRYKSVEMDTSMGTMDFEYELLYVPEGLELPSPDDFGAYLSDVLVSIVRHFSDDGNVVFDPIDDE